MRGEWQRDVPGPDRLQTPETGSIIFVGLDMATVEAARQEDRQRTLIMALVLAVLTAILAVKIGDWFSIPPELVREARALTWVVGLGWAVSTPLQLTTAVLSGMRRLLLPPYFTRSSTAAGSASG